MRPPLWGSGKCAKSNSAGIRKSEHLDLLAAELRKYGLYVVTLQGGMRKRDLRDALSARSQQETPRSMVILATGRFAGEGFDDTALDSLFLTLPVSWKGLVAQYVGRLHRQSGEKQQVRVFLLQQNGYLVLRFLAEDLTLRLSSVLDTVLRCIS